MKFSNFSLVSFIFFANVQLFEKRNKKPLRTTKNLQNSRNLQTHPRASKKHHKTPKPLELGFGLIIINLSLVYIKDVE